MGQPRTMKTFKTDDSPGPDDLVPSRYAVRVGEIDVLVISDGVLEPPAESMATNADPATRNAWLDRSFLAPDTFDWALNAGGCAAGLGPFSSTAGLVVKFRTSRGPGCSATGWPPRASIWLP